MRDERIAHTLQPTALVNEAYIRLVGSLNREWKTRSHFIGVACCVMRQVLIDHARRKKAAIRGGGRQRVSLDEDALPLRQQQSERLLDLDKALGRLKVMDPRKSQIVEMRYFGGLSVDETAETLGIAPRTVKRDWTLARAWLRGEMFKEVEG